MAIDYVNAQNIVEEAINDNGRDIILIQQNRTASDPAKPWRGAVDLSLDATSITIKAVWSPVSGNRFSRRTGANEEQLHKADSDQFLLDGRTVVAAGIDLTAYDAVQDGTLIWRIISVEELKPGPLTLMFYLNVSR